MGGRIAEKLAWELRRPGAEEEVQPGRRPSKRTRDGGAEAPMDRGTGAQGYRDRFNKRQRQTERERERQRERKIERERKRER